MYQVVNMENLRSGELYVFSDNEFFNPPSYAVVSGREIGGRQKGPARAGSFHCRCKQFAGGEGLAQMPRFDSGAIDRAALGNGIVFFYIGRVSDGQIGL